MTAHGIVARHETEVICSCGAVLYAAGRTAQRRAWFQHSDEERER